MFTLFLVLGYLLSCKDLQISTKHYPGVVDSFVYVQVKCLHMNGQRTVPVCQEYKNHVNGTL